MPSSCLGGQGDSNPRILQGIPTFCGMQRAKCVQGSTSSTSTTGTGTVSGWQPLRLAVPVSDSTSSAADSTRTPARVAVPVPMAATGCSATQAGTVTVNVVALQ